MLRASDFRQKEVINISDGKRLGFVYDVDFDDKEGFIQALVIPCNGKVFGIFGKDTEYVIPWESIKK